MPPGASVGTLAAGTDDAPGRAVDRAEPDGPRRAEVAVAFRRSEPDKIVAGRVALRALREGTRAAVSRRHVEGGEAGTYSVTLVMRVGLGAVVSAALEVVVVGGGVVVVVVVVVGCEGKASVSDKCHGSELIRLESVPWWSW